jgi:TatD DNase family protein
VSVPEPPGSAAGGGVPAGLAFDSHCHLDLLDAEVAQVLADARAAGITRVVTVGYDLASSRWAARCAAQHADVYAAVAIHPNETAKAARAAPQAGPSAGGMADAAPEAVLAEAVLAEIAELAALPRVRAVGETGLDYYRDSSEPAVQRQWFRAHIEIAKQVGKALVIHDRDAHGDVLAILAADGAPERVVFHCFSGDEEMVKVCAAAGYFMSFAGNVTFTSAAPLRAAARAVPVKLLLVETDAPYLTPVPYRGRPNSPALIPHTLRCLAGIRGMDVPELGAAVLATGERVFGGFS